MEPEPASRKRRFIPKAPQRRVPKPEVKTEVDHAMEEADAEKATELLRQFNEGASRASPKLEKKVAPTQIVFGYGCASTSMKSYGVPKGGSNGSATDAAASGVRVEKEYSSPWDQYSYYPVTLPLRPPYSGNPGEIQLVLQINAPNVLPLQLAQIRSVEEFGEGSEESAYDENSTKPANVLGLLEENKATTMFFLQFPQSMPMIKRSPTADSHEATKSSGPPGGARNTQKPCALSELPAGFMGKMLVYRSGAIKLKLGDGLFDVSPGMNSNFSQDVVAYNKAGEGCGVIREPNRRASITPDIDSILKSIDCL